MTQLRVEQEQFQELVTAGRHVVKCKNANGDELDTAIAALQSSLSNFIDGGDYTAKQLELIDVGWRVVECHEDPSDPNLADCIDWLDDELGAVMRNRYSMTSLEIREIADSPEVPSFTFGSEEHQEWTRQHWNANTGLSIKDSGFYVVVHKGVRGSPTFRVLSRWRYADRVPQAWDVNEAPVGSAA